jgi:lipid-A-disaccharide synthase
MRGGTCDIVIISNSPGELSSWVKVTSQRLKEKRPDLRIILVLVPCPYASGKEVQVAEKFPSIDIVVPPSRFLQFLFLGKLPPGYKPSHRGVVVFLGGDYWHAAGMAWKLKYPAVAYTTRAYAGLSRYFRHIFCPYESIKEELEKQGVPPEKLVVAGNLMVEGVKPTMSREEGRRKWNLAPDLLTVGIFPGSRLYHVQDSLPVFLKVAEEIKEQVPGVQFVLGLSPFLTVDEIKDCLKSPDTPIPGSGGSVSNSGAGYRIITEGGLPVQILESGQYDAMNVSDLVLTIPGTNTAECAYLGRPMVVASSWKARIPRGGLGFFINSLPIGGFRRAVMHRMLEQLKYMSLPNLIAQSPIVPEVMVEDRAEEITGVAVRLIRDGEGRQKMSLRLREIMGETGAVEKITGTILNLIEPREAT